MSEMKNHYTYLMQHRITGMCYIGVRTCKCLIGDDKYTGSSKYMSKEDRDGCNKIILGRFDTREDAVGYEVLLHNMFDVASNRVFWNKSKQTATSFDTSGRKASKEERERISIVQLRRYESSVSPLRGRVLTEEHKKKLRQSSPRKPRLQSTKALMSEKSKGVNNSSFRPWWYSTGGTTVYVYDMTPSEKAVSMGFKPNAFKDRFKVKYSGKVVTNGPLKGMNFGRL